MNADLYSLVESPPGVTTSIPYNMTHEEDYPYTSNDCPSSS